MEGHAPSPRAHRGAYARIHAQVARVPRGKVATYGQIAGLVEGVTARMVGYALAATPEGVDIPWHRIVNARGLVSPRSVGDGHAEQRARLEAEGIAFSESGRLDLARHRWRP